jgi:hypothetical protein
MFNSFAGCCGALTATVVAVAYFVGTNVIFLRIGSEMQDFVSTNISYIINLGYMTMYYRTLEYADTVPFPYINRKIEYSQNAFYKPKLQKNVHANNCHPILLAL